MENIQKHIDTIKEQDIEFHNIVITLRKIVHELAPDALENIKYWGIVFSYDELFCWIYVSKNHVTLEFSKWYLLDNTHGFLEWSGKFRRHIKFHSVQDITSKYTVDYIKKTIATLRNINT